MGAYNDDVLFIHIPKTGGWSVKHWMIEHLPNVLCPDPEDKAKTEASKLPIGHIPLSDIERFTGRPLDSWQKIIGIIRNPYDQQVSQWAFWRDRYARGQRHVHDICAAQYPSIHKWLDDPMCDFHLWYEHRFHASEPIVRKTPGPDTDYANFGGYYLYWLAVGGVIPDNVEIIKLEEIDTLPTVVEPYTLRKDMAPLGVENTSPRGRYQEYYSHPDREVADHALERVHQKFRWTFEQGHYKKIAFATDD